METVEERIVRLLVEEKTLLKILRTIDGQFDKEGLDEWINRRHISITKDNPIWVN
ncbi:MAG TPA: hypothetical protein VFI64_06395 [Nitrososphaeraceae archaeon]|nr:hypothetical protein [Nitrososphaeraceae archaeon]